MDNNEFLHVGRSDCCIGPYVAVWTRTPCGAVLLLRLLLLLGLRAGWPLGQRALLHAEELLPRQTQQRLQVAGQHPRRPLGLLSPTWK